MKRLVPFLMTLSLAVLFSCSEKGGTAKEGEAVPESKRSYPAPAIEKNPLVDYTKWEIRDGKFFLDGKWVFLKIGKPLTDYSDPNFVNHIIDCLDIYREKYFNAIEINCYWFMFDMDGDGIPDKSLEPLRRLVEAIYNKGMYPCITVETYSVGGGRIPEGFFERYPDAYAINADGVAVKDTEYGMNTKVISIFHQGYRDTVHKYIKAIASGVDTRHVLWFETTVEPQYMGTIPLCYSESARMEYNKWREANNITDEASRMPETFPIPSSFIENPTWNKFRAQWLAKWVNDDAAAWREVAGEDAYVAVDYLETGNPEMFRRNGDSREFLRCLTSPTIIQVNHHWALQRHEPNMVAYDNVHEANELYHRNWAISEHMTFNGDDFNFPVEEVDRVLENTLRNGTRFGWEFTNVLNDSNQTFSLYADHFTPKGPMKEVDNYWGWWMHRVETIEESGEGYSYKAK